MKKNILFFILGFVAAGNISVYAAIKYQASEIEYNDTPLDEVLDDLYTQTFDKGLNYDNINYKIVSFQERKQTTDITLSLTEGKYICNYSISFYTSGSDNTINGESNNYVPSVSGCDSTNTINGISKTVAASTSWLKNSSDISIYTNGSNHLYTFTCNLNSNKLITITHTTTANATTNVGTTELINCIEIK